jgi:hypothetical protein
MKKRSKTVSIANLLEFDVYPHPWRDRGWHINIFPNKNRFADGAKFTSKVKAMSGLNEMLIKIRNDIDDYLAGGPR